MVREREATFLEEKITMTTETMSAAVKQPVKTTTTLRALIYSTFFRNVKAEQHPGFYGRASMGL